MPDWADDAKDLTNAETDALLGARPHRIPISGRETCCDCKEPIEPARRAVLPEAQRCAFCQGQIEERLRR